jgi:hypothetical protein
VEEEKETKATEVLSSVLTAPLILNCVEKIYVGENLEIQLCAKYEG